MNIINGLYVVTDKFGGKCCAMTGCLEEAYSALCALYSQAPKGTFDGAFVHAFFQELTIENGVIVAPAVDINMTEETVSEMPFSDIAENSFKVFALSFLPRDYICRFFPAFAAAVEEEEDDSPRSVLEVL